VFYSLAGSAIRRFFSGLADITRLGLSPYEVWRDILDTNHASVGEALDAYIETLRELRAGLTSAEMAERFDAANRFAASLRNNPPKT